MAANEGMQVGAWRLGLDPRASGSVIRSMTRVELPVGDALRVEMIEPASPDIVHVQYFIGTDAGGWALWISCHPSMLGAFEASLPSLTRPRDDDAGAQSR